MRISDAQHGVLHQIKEFGPINTSEVYGPRDMAGKRKVKLETGKLTAATLDKLVSLGLVAVSRGKAYRPTDATGRRGHERCPICISITVDGLAKL